MVPSYFIARYALLQFYMGTNQYERAFALAVETLDLPFSDENRDALRARDLALLVLDLEDGSVSMEKMVW
jgi:hypothetical protein